VKDLNFETKKGGSLGMIMPSDDFDAGEDDDDFIKRVKKTKVDKLYGVDHSKIQYLF